MAALAVAGVSLVLDDDTTVQPACVEAVDAAEGLLEVDGHLITLRGEWVYAETTGDTAALAVLGTRRGLLLERLRVLAGDFYTAAEACRGAS